MHKPFESLVRRDMMMPSTRSAVDMPQVERRERTVLRGLIDDYIFVNPSYQERADTLRTPLADLVHAYAYPGFQLRLLRVLSSAAKTGDLELALSHFAYTAPGTTENDHIPVDIAEKHFSTWPLYQPS